MCKVCGVCCVKSVLDVIDTYGVNAGNNSVYLIGTCIMELVL